MLTLKVISPEKVVFTGEVESVTVPGTLGAFEILVDHAPLISSLESGVVTYLPNGGAKAQLNILGGSVEVQKNELRPCAAVYH